MMDSDFAAPRTSNSATKEHVLSELKSDFRYSLFFLLPKIRPGIDWRRLAAEIQLPERLAERFADDLINTGYWEVDKEGAIQVPKDHLDLGDLNISEFLSMSINLLAHMHVNGPCWYDTLLVITNDQLKKEFYRKVNLALKDLMEASQKIEGDSILAWSHAGLDCLKALGEKNT